MGDGAGDLLDGLGRAEHLDIRAELRQLADRGGRG
jgi:hypothetical protein